MNTLYIYFDLKITDDNKHKEYCGVSNRSILENFSSLYALSKERGFELLPRTPLIPGITDGLENLKSIADYLKGLGVEKAQLLSYNPLWPGKCEQIGVPYIGEEKSSLTTWMTPKRVDECKAVFLDSGICV